MSDILRDLWAEEAPEVNSRRSIGHLAVVPILVAVSLVDGLLSSDVGWPALSIPLMTALPLVLYWRHSHMLLVALVVAATYAALHGAMLVAGVMSTFLNGGLIGLMTYTLARWGSGREAIIGLAAVSVGTGIAGSTGVLREQDGAIGLPVFVVLVVLLGLAVRFWSGRGAARLSEARTLERNRIARELHDTVAHHVSAIAVQAQGGQEIVSTSPEAAAEAFAVIEGEASRTLAEMRLILGVLRNDGPVDLAPQPGITDIARLADDTAPGPHVEVAISGVDNISATVASSLFRLTQEAVTNARRHARRASHIAVRVVGSGDQIHLTVTDDGEATPQSRSGYGLLGMAERAALLGGVCQAGPAPGGGWTVEASLPLTGDAP